MQTFRFRMQKVLEWYTHQYKQEERKLAAVMVALLDTQKAIAALQAERLCIERDMVSRLSIPASDFVALGLYRLGTKKQELELNAVRGKRQSAVDAQRTKLQAAQRRVRLLEKLRERRVAEYDYEEARELEELASDAFFAKWAAR